MWWELEVRRKLGVPVMEAVVNGFIGGWDINSFYIASSGEPADLPGNAFMLKDPKIPVDRKSTSSGAGILASCKPMRMAPLRRRGRARWSTVAAPPICHSMPGWYRGMSF